MDLAPEGPAGVDPFGRSRERLEEIVGWLDGTDAAGLEHGEPVCSCASSSPAAGPTPDSGTDESAAATVSTIDRMLRLVLAAAGCVRDRGGQIATVLDIRFGGLKRGERDGALDVRQRAPAERGAAVGLACVVEVGLDAGGMVRHTAASGEGNGDGDGAVKYGRSLTASAPPVRFGGAGSEAPRPGLHSLAKPARRKGGGDERIEQRGG